MISHPLIVESCKLRVLLKKPLVDAKKRSGLDSTLVSHPQYVLFADIYKKFLKTLYQDLYKV